MFIRIRTNTAEKTSFILKTCPDDDAVRHHGLGEWLPPSGKPLRGLETNPFFTMSMSWPRLLRGNSYRVAVCCNQLQTEKWWSQTESNRRPQACKASALPTELWPRRNTHIIEARTDCKLPATSDAIQIVLRPPEASRE
jgi:hypothetical protein